MAPVSSGTVRIAVGQLWHTVPSDTLILLPGLVHVMEIVRVRDVWPDFRYAWHSHEIKNQRAMRVNRQCASVFLHWWENGAVTLVNDAPPGSDSTLLSREMFSDSW